jgi:hypothetical protein
MIFAVLENHLAIVVACAPSVKVIALLLFPRLASSFEKIVSKVTPSSSRSRSRASGPSYGTNDLESGTRRSDKLKPTPIGTPLPSPAFTTGSGASRASRNFARWFKGPASPRGMASGDSMEGGLVYVEEMEGEGKDRNVPLVIIPKETGTFGDASSRAMSPVGDNDIRVEHTITVEERDASSRGSGDSDTLGRAV